MCNVINICLKTVPRIQIVRFRLRLRRDCLEKIVMCQKSSLCSEKDFSVLENFAVFSKRLLCSRNDCCVLEKIVVFQKRNRVVSHLRIPQPH